MSFFHPIAALCLMSMRAAFFGPAYRHLPLQVRAGSPGFISLAVAFFVASAVRYAMVAGEPLSQLFVSQALYFAVLFAMARTRLVTELALYLSVSIGLDLLVAAAGVVGANIQDPSLVTLAFVWEWAATFVAVARLWHQRRIEAAAARAVSSEPH
jgi:hypothetical protein